MDSFNTTATTNDKMLLKRIEHVISSSSLVSGGEPIVIAVSGGPDSLCLLHVLSSLLSENKCIAVYVDHGLRPQETDEERKVVQSAAATCSAEFISIAVDVRGEREKKRCSLEEAARNLRYQALEQIRHSYGAQAIAVGHTADDQAEEILLRLIRGSGSSGLSGMSLRHGTVIRPLLHEKKETLLRFLKNQSITFCEDSSNRDRRFLRNRIRLELLPYLENEYNRSMRQTLLQTAAILDEENSLLDEWTERSFPEMVYEKEEQVILRLALFHQVHPAIQRRVLEKICWQMASRPTFKTIESLLRLSTAGKNREVHLSGGLRAIRQSDAIHFHYPSKTKGYRGPSLVRNDFSPLTLPGPGRYRVVELEHELLIKEYTLPLEKSQQDTLLLDAATVHFPLTLRPSAVGERFHPLGAPGKKKITRFLSDQKIPTMEREQYPLLLDGDRIVALLGLRIDHACRITDKTSNVLLLKWLPVER